MGDTDHTAARFDRWAATYDRSALQPLLYTPVQQAALCLAAHHHPTPGRVLDVGCATGTLLRQAAQRFPEARLVGIDPAPRMVAAARAATPAGLPIHFVHACAEHLPFADGSFDLAISTLSFRHWDDQAAGIAQIRRVLTAGGVLTLADDFAIRPGRTVGASPPVATGSKQPPRRHPRDAGQQRPDRHRLAAPTRLSSGLQSRGGGGAHTRRTRPVALRHNPGHGRARTAQLGSAAPATRCAVSPRPDRSAVATTSPDRVATARSIHHRHGHRRHDGREPWRPAPHA
jgi:SAM-dependent methyltransferase